MTKSKTGSIRLNELEYFRLMQWTDQNKERINHQMTWPEILQAAQQETGMPGLTRDHLSGCLRRFGLVARPEVRRSPTQPDAGRGHNGSPLRGDGKIRRLTVAEKYEVLNWVRDSRDRIHRKMTYEECVAEVERRTGVRVTRNILARQFSHLGISVRPSDPAPRPEPPRPATSEPAATEAVTPAVVTGDVEGRMAQLEEQVSEFRKVINHNAALIEKIRAVVNENIDTVANNANVLRQAAEELNRRAKASDLAATEGRLVALDARVTTCVSRLDAMAKLRMPAADAQFQAKIQQDLTARQKLYDHDIGVIRSLLNGLSTSLGDLSRRVADLEGAVIGPQPAK